MIVTLSAKPPKTSQNVAVVLVLSRLWLWLGLGLGLRIGLGLGLCYAELTCGINVELTRGLMVTVRVMVEG